MSQIAADLRRVASSSGLYALANLLQRGLSFILLPVYTRFLETPEYGVLELLNGLSAILFGLLLLGMPSALQKVFHRDCDTEEEQKRVLPTALLLDLPALALGSGLLFIFAEPVGAWLLGEPGYGPAVQLTVAAVVASSLVAIVLSAFRAREQAVAYAMLNFAQFGLGMALNVVLVVWLRMGIYGVLWGNLVAAAATLPAGLWIARRDIELRIDRRLVAPLLHFGLLVVPTAITGWVITMADRYVLRFFGSLEEVAIYSVGYKIGMILQMGLVWPFQLAWPAVAFSISRRAGHEATYARVLTYLVFGLALGVVGLSLMARAGLGAFAGPSYAEAHRVVPWVALAYAFAGIQFCLSPSVHIRGKTKYLALFSVGGTIVNLGLNLLLVPSYGMMGATWATTASYAVLMLATAILSLRIHPLPLETGRLLKITAVSLAVLALGLSVDPHSGLFASLTWQAFLALALLPALLLAVGFLRPGERRRIHDLFRRLTEWTRENRV
ncbi:MAG: oligosaccharide flippase family protein [Acidobacteriota bacterium]